DVVVAMSGYGGPALGVRTGGSGDVTNTHRLWLQDQPKPPQRVGSGVVVDGLIYILNEPNWVWCIDPKTGERKWEKQRAAPGRSWCSMVHAAGRLYVDTEQGTTLVLKPD